MCNCSKTRGDTLIEVLFAIAIFSLVAVGGLSIMNQGLATSQRALEITLVRQEIDSQAEALRFLNASYAAAYQLGVSYPLSTPAGQWVALRNSVKTTSNTDVSAFGMTITSKCPTIRPNGSFIIDTHSAKFIVPSATVRLLPAQTFSQVRYDKISKQITSAEGIWIEAILNEINGNNQTNADYIDFHIRACWDSPGQSVPVTIGTIVRLYEPRG